jgi:hypothetical protein
LAAVNLLFFFSSFHVVMPSNIHHSAMYRGVQGRSDSTCGAFPGLGANLQPPPAHANQVSGGLDRGGLVSKEWDTVPLGVVAQVIAPAVEVLGLLLVNHLARDDDARRHLLDAQNLHAVQEEDDEDGARVGLDVLGFGFGLAFFFFFFFFLKRVHFIATTATTTATTTDH